MHTHLGTTDHQGIAHIVAGIPHINKIDALQTAEMLFDRQKVGQNLRGMKFVGQPVPNGDGSVFGKLFHNFLAEATVFNAVVHPTEDTGGVGNGLLFADLRPGGI